MLNTSIKRFIPVGLIGLASIAGGCEGAPKSEPAGPRRAEIRPVGPSTIEIVPAPGQLEHCLVYTESEKGVIRQLTMSFEDRSVPCEAGKPIGDEKYKIPVKEGKVRTYVIFSDRPLKGSSVAAQLNEAWSNKRTLTAMDLRAPGQVAIETLEFNPSK
jgi:hypothetical protein